MELEILAKQVIACRKCPRLVKWREQVALHKRRSYTDWDYWGKPVPGFGDPHAKVLIVGLAPGAHGSNRTGRQFTGDASGRFLYPALHRAGFANQADAQDRNDGLILKDAYVTACCRCAPPENRPTPQELANCLPYLLREIDLIRPKVIVCLGRIAFAGVLRVYSERPSAFAFAHGAVYRATDRADGVRPWFVCSYHPSQQNTLTGRLTAPMFDQIWATARELTRDAKSASNR